MTDNEMVQLIETKKKAIIKRSKSGPIKYHSLSLATDKIDVMPKSVTEIKTIKQMWATTIEMYLLQQQ